MENQIFIIDAFTNEPFKGNQAGVCLIKEDLETVDKKIFQKIAFEMNLSETAFVSPKNTKENFTDAQEFNLKWFTPTTEVSLCGHATLGSAHVLFNELHNKHSKILFHTLSGVLTVRLKDNELIMDFPKNESHTIQPINSIMPKIGLKEEEIITWEYEPVLGNLLIEVQSEELLKNLQPNIEVLTSQSYEIKLEGILLTAKMTNSIFDFASRYFAPWVGINEDPVTGSTHTTLGPYWQRKLSKNKFFAFQASRRSGQMKVLVQDDRVLLYGTAVTTLRGLFRF